jgi:hypothetical protein
MAITAHYVDAEFNIKKKIIWFKVLEYPHSGFAIKEEIMRCLTEWGIRDKLFTLTLDNASNNTTASQTMKISYCLKVSIYMLDVRLIFLTSWFRMACQ